MSQLVLGWIPSENTAGVIGELEKNLVECIHSFLTKEIMWRSDDYVVCIKNGFRLDSDEGAIIFRPTESRTFLVTGVIASRCADSIYTFFTEELLNDRCIWLQEPFKSSQDFEEYCNAKEEQEREAEWKAKLEAEERQAEWEAEEEARYQLIENSDLSKYWDNEGRSENAPSGWDGYAAEYSSAAGENRDPSTHY